MRLFLSDSIYGSMAPLFIGPTVLFVSKEPKVREMLSTLRVSPHMTLLGKTELMLRDVSVWRDGTHLYHLSAGACIDNTLLSVQGVVGYSKLPSMTVVQGELVSGLTMLTSHTVSVLQRHPGHLSALLQQYIKQQSPEAASEAKTESAT